MCLAPSLIINPQARYFLHNYPSKCSVYFDKKDYFGPTIYADTIFQSLLRLKEKRQYTALQIYDFYRLSTVRYLSNTYPLFVLCPCGSCSDCRESYRKEIEARALVEAAHSGTVVFYTLTYDNVHLPNDGLCKSDVVDAFKRLRTYIDRYLDFDVTFTQVYVGEYGTDPRYTMRPHYHGIMFIEESLTVDQFFKFKSLFYGTHECYDEHVLDGFWPFGRRVDLQLGRKPAALTRYVTKYITKQYIAMEHSDFSALAKKINGYENKMFVQLPKSQGLGCRYISEYADSILNSSNASMYVRFSDGSLIRTRIPRIFIQKLIPSLSWYLPNAIRLVKLTARLIDWFSTRVGLSTDSTISLNERFQPYSYLAGFTLRKKQYLSMVRELETYYSFYLSSDDLLEIGELYSVIDYHLQILESACPTKEQYYDLIIKPKSDYLRKKILPEYTTELYCEIMHNKAQNSVEKTKRTLMFSAYNSFQ